MFRLKTRFSTNLLYCSAFDNGPFTNTIFTNKKTPL